MLGIGRMSAEVAQRCQIITPLADSAAPTSSFILNTVERRRRISIFDRGDDEQADARARLHRMGRRRSCRGRHVDHNESSLRAADGAWRALAGSSLCSRCLVIDTSQQFWTGGAPVTGIVYEGSVLSIRAIRSRSQRRPSSILTLHRAKSHSRGSFVMPLRHTIGGMAEMAKRCRRQHRLQMVFSSAGIFPTCSSTGVGESIPRSSMLTGGTALLHWNPTAHSAA